MSKHRKRSGHGFYIIAAALLLAVGVTARLSMGSIDPDKTESNDSSSITSYYSTESEIEEQTEKTESTPSESEASSLDTTVSETEAEDKEKTEEEPQNVAAEKVVTFALPITGDIIKSFDLSRLQYSKTYGDMRLHTGIDIIGEEGTTVKASADGTVKSVTTDPLWGLTVVIEHSGGIETHYCGLNDTSVEVGQEIKMSKIVGTIGKVPSECLDESHLHFGIKQGDTWLSPLSVMGLE